MSGRFVCNSNSRNNKEQSLCRFFLSKLTEYANIRFLHWVLSMRRLFDEASREKPSCTQEVEVSNCRIKNLGMKIRTGELVQKNSREEKANPWLCGLQELLQTLGRAPQDRALGTKKGRKGCAKNRTCMFIQEMPWETFILSRLLIEVSRTPQASLHMYTNKFCIQIAEKDCWPRFNERLFLKLKGLRVCYSLPAKQL